MIVIYLLIGLKYLSSRQENLVMALGVIDFSMANCNIGLTILNLLYDEFYCFI